MGVNGLWTVVQPCARPTNLATLNRKRLAVDASIWIYQFLKAVRDKEGNALRNSHVVGFFRRICKLLWFGIKPIFVFDGGAPALKRATLQGRRRRREGRREDAVRTAGKLLAVQMQRIAQEEDEKRKERERQRDTSQEDRAVPGEELPDMSNIVYADEAFKPEEERRKDRKFFRQDQYHLPELGTSIEKMGKPEDPRIMSVEELEDYARQFHNGEDVNLYDFSKIDFDGDFFKSLPPADRYNILNAARLRSRLRMGLSKEQLGIMFPNRMDFSRFQVERVQERNRLTQRLMFEMNMGGDLTVTGGGRVAGDKNREYILVRNENADGGWALGVVSTEKDLGEAHKPIDVDKLHFQVEPKDEDDDADEDEDEDFEDVPIEGLNRLPKLRGHRVRFQDGLDQDAESLFGDENEASNDLFVAQDNEEEFAADEDEDVARAIEMSLRNQHGTGKEAEATRADGQLEDVQVPEWKQKAVDGPQPIASTAGSMVAHIINNRANASVPKRRQIVDSDSEEDLQAALRAARKRKSAVKPKPTEPIRPNVKNPFDGPLPFEKLNWRNSIFEKKPQPKPHPDQSLQDIFESEGGFQIEVPDAKLVRNAQAAGSEDIDHLEDENLEGGFDKETGADKAPQPLPPWMINDESDIREKVQKQRQIETVVNEEDQRLAEEEERLRLKRRNKVVEIGSSDDDDGFEIVDAPPNRPAPLGNQGANETSSAGSGFTITLPSLDKEISGDVLTADPVANPGDAVSQNSESENHNSVHQSRTGPSPSSEMEFENVELPQQSHTVGSHPRQEQERDEAEDIVLEDVEMSQEQSEVTEVSTWIGKAAENEEAAFKDVAPSTAPVAQEERAEDIAPVADPPIADDDGIFSDGDYEEFSDPEEEQLLAQMAEEAEEHARFASQLNNKPAYQNQEDYERELRALRTQQKKDRRDADEVTQIMVTECQALLRLFGIPYITAPMEAEAQCAELVHLGLVDGIVTDDSDIFLFGGTRVYKNMFNSNKFVECYLSDDLEKELSLSRDQLISIAQLLGSDYTEGLPGIGPVTAVEILSEFPGRDGLTEFKGWWSEVQQNANRPKEADAHSVFRKKFRKSQATKLFLPPSFPSPAVYDAYLHPDVDKNPEQFQWGAPDLEGLRRYLMATIGWSPERTDEVLVPVIRDVNRRDMEGTQSNITRYFEGSVGVGAKEAFAPRQRKAGSKRMAAAVDRLRANVSGADTATAGPDNSGDGRPVEGSQRAPRGSHAGKTRKRKARVAAVVESDGDDDNDDDNDGEGDGDEDFVDEDTQGATGRKTGTQKKGRGKAKGKKVKN
ncbi:DNA excision repair protein [Diaporthe helianthi]|uniref:DNA excision repair protein n=1 Tax=Diaporthe helianthi TaxID=158607 RepID=A0A2P5HMR6_DIAHE|nr:DNA excision repair protein [Diaporthe helianthi]